jgi:hypothetical protein
MGWKVVLSCGVTLAREKSSAQNVLVNTRDDRPCAALVSSSCHDMASATVL